MPSFLLNAGLALFFMFDIGLPVLVVLARLVHDALKAESS